MSRIIAIGSPPIEVHLRRSARARRYSLKVSNTDGSVSLVLPTHAPETAALDFARRQEGWLRSALARQPQTAAPEFGGHVPYHGRPLLLAPGKERSVRLTGDRLEIPGAPDALAAKLAGFLKVRAREDLAAATATYAKALSRPVAALTLRDTKSRWGSCSADGRLMFSWRLVMAPPGVLSYVAAHEVAHLVEMNHSPAFWRLVRDLMPDYQPHRTWLKRNGAALHAIRFDRRP
ncbi:MAG: M48 family metallopeptidase [Rhodobacteraceae bacterium]|nr:M48 family metallopeptidase [Paracoccaceae bacterium]